VSRLCVAYSSCPHEDLRAPTLGGSVVSISSGHGVAYGRAACGECGAFGVGGGPMSSANTGDEVVVFPVPGDGELSDVELLSSALADAVDAHRLGLVVGPVVDEVALRRVERRAQRADFRRWLMSGGPGDVA
jgi:hypothetical protein